MSTVLLVDDDQVTVARNGAALAAAGHRVAVASTTSEAIASIRHTVPDIVVLEGLLDGATAGFDLARALASSHPDLPLIMLTRADDVLSPRERAHQDRDGGWLPVQRYLEKPVMPEVLADEVEHLVHEPVAAR
jgi:CheY-like chemotaxis protein